MPVLVKTCHRKPFNFSSKFFKDFIYHSKILKIIKKKESHSKKELELLYFEFWSPNMHLYNNLARIHIRIVLQQTSYHNL